MCTHGSLLLLLWLVAGGITIRLSLLCIVRKLQLCKEILFVLLLGPVGYHILLDQGVHLFLILHSLLIHEIYILLLYVYLQIWKARVRLGPVQNLLIHVFLHPRGETLIIAIKNYPAHFILDMSHLPVQHLEAQEVIYQEEEEEYDSKPYEDHSTRVRVLSSGEIAGITVAVVVLFAAAILIPIFIVLKQRQRHRTMRQAGY